MNALLSHLDQKEHVIWDWNGTLLADLDLAIAIVNRLLREEGLAPIDLASYRQVFGFPVIEYYRKLGFRTEREYFLQLCERFNQHFQEGLPSCTLWPGVREVLSEVKRSGRRQSLLSASEHSILTASIRHFELEEHFDHIFGIFDKTAASKVERGHELLRRAGVPVEKCILIGDTDHDLEVGKALGIDVILVEHGHQHPDRLRAIHHNVVDVLSAEANFKSN
jgi:phosphoglycolate phosphatase